MLSEIGKNIYKEAYKHMFRFISFKRRILWTLEIRSDCMRRRGFALQSRSGGFLYKFV